MRFLNPEETYLKEHTLSEEKLSSAEEKVSEEYFPEYQSEEPKMDDFSDIYSREKIEDDKNELAEIKKKHQYEKTERSIILETVLTKHIEQSNWIGENCYVVQTSKYDDVINHTDLIVEFEREKNDEATRLAIDVTTSEDREVLDKKIKYITTMINKEIYLYISKTQYNITSKYALL